MLAKYSYLKWMPEEKVELKFLCFRRLLILLDQSQDIAASEVRVQQLTKSKTDVLKI